MPDMSAGQAMALENLNEKLKDAQSFMAEIAKNIRLVGRRSAHEQRMMNPVAQWLGGIVTLGMFNAGSHISVGRHSRM